MKYAIDCEMAGATNGANILARVSIVDEHYNVVYDQIVRPKPSISVGDSRAAIHGIQLQQLFNGRDFFQVQREVKNIISGKVLIGHSVDKDLLVLELSHPDHLIRDVSTYQPFKKYNTSGPPSLKDLAYHLLGKNIQTGLHSSVEDAKASMELYKREERNWN